MTHMIFQRITCLLVGSLFLISACTGQLQNATQTSPASTAVTNGETSTTEPTSSSTGPIVLTLWLPPFFDPAGGTLASSMLQNRLSDFIEQHPQLRVDVRVKAEEGSGGLLDSLIAAHEAAPLALPDLVLLPSSLLPLAVEADILQPLDGLTEELLSDDWYPFAQQIATVEGQEYGLPFAADALVLAYRPTAIQNVPTTWSAALSSRQAIGFAAADPLALFSISQLLSLQSSLEPVSEDIHLANQSLADVFDFYESARQRGVFPHWLTQYQTTEQSWQAFSEGATPMVVAWASRVFGSRPDEVSGAPLPTQDGQPFTLAKGWVWSISAEDSGRAELAAELAEYLTTPEFIAQWSAAAGLLPPRASSLAAWSPDEKQALASQIVGDAAAFPDQNTLISWGEAVSQAVIALLKDEVNSAEAAQIVQGFLANP